MKCTEAHILLADRLTSDEEKSGIQAVRAGIGNDLDNHLAACKECSALAADMNASLAAWKSDRPWSPPESYWNNLLPRINERIAERAARRANPFARLLTIARWLVVPVAALTVVLVMTNPHAPVSYPTSDEISAVVNTLPADELTTTMDHARWEDQFTSAVSDSSSMAMTDDDKAEILDILSDDATELSTIPAFTLSAAPLSTIQSENDGALFASADDVFDTIQPRLEQSLASISH